MTGQKGETLVGELFKDMQTSTGLVFNSSLYSPVEALMRKELLLGYKWTEFVKQLAAKSVNANISINELAVPPKPVASYTNSADDQVSTRFQWDAADLSAYGQKVVFQARATKWATGTKLTLQLRSLANDAVAHLYQPSGQGWAYQGSFTSTIEVTGVDLLAKNGGQLFVLVANGHAQRPFAGTTPISLDLDISVKTAEVPIEKADVLIEVYRVYKNPVGTSNQECNDYSITISDPKGGVAETGASAARNGAYDTRLVVGDGYSYSIRYSYTSPCRDSGTTTGKFDVKRNIINYVEVETPRCETN
jgi:hypothetical protein